MSALMELLTQARGIDKELDVTLQSISQKIGEKTEIERIKELQLKVEQLVATLTELRIDELNRNVTDRRIDDVKAGALTVIEESGLFWVIKVYNKDHMRMLSPAIRKAISTVFVDWCISKNKECPELFMNLVDSNGVIEGDFENV